MKISDSGNGGGDFENPEAGTYAAVCHKVIDLGTQHGEYQGKPRSVRKLLIEWELDEKMKDGRPFVVGSFYTASLNEKATLRKHLESWRGIQFTAEELKGFSVQKLIGAPCMLSLIKNEAGKVRVNAISKLPKGMTAPAPVNPPVYLSLDSEEFNEAVFDEISNGLKKMIVASPEYQAIGVPAQAAQGQGQAEAGKAAVDIPF